MASEEYPYAGKDAERYWATEEEEDVLVSACQERFKVYLDSLENHETFPKIVRNYCYYHGMFYGRDHRYTFRDLRRMGEQGELVGANVNHFRSIIQNIISLVTQHKIQYQTRAVNTSQAALDQARLGDNVLNYYRSNLRIDRHFTRALEHCLVLLQGFVFTFWNEDEGERIEQQPGGEVDPETGEETSQGYIHEGDVRSSNPTIFDVARDTCEDQHERAQWFIIREHRNKWDLIAKYPDLQEEILHSDKESDDREGRFLFDPTDSAGRLTDLISVYTLIHRRTPALPDGKIFSFVGRTSGSGVALDAPNQPLIYHDCTLRRMVASEALMSVWGYAPSCDLQSLQEIYNGEISTIVTNHKTFGVQNIWHERGDKVSGHTYEGSLRVLSSRTKPEALQLTKTAPEIVNFPPAVRQDMEMVSGVNATVRGQPEASLKSGVALALVESKATQILSPLQTSYYQLQEDVGTDYLKILNSFASEDHERIISVQGPHGKSTQYKFRRGGMDSVDFVSVEVGSAMTRTLAGRIELAQLFVKAGLVRLPEELINVIETGNMDPLVESERAQLQLVRDENESMLKGIAVRVLISDYHILHIREHQTLLNSTEVRTNANFVQLILGHLMEHVQQLQNPGTQILQMAIGFPTGIPALGVPGQEGGGPDRPPEGPPGENQRMPGFPKTPEESITSEVA